MKTKVKLQTVNKHYALYCGDCCDVIKGIPDESIGFSIYSPPFASLYTYSDDIADMGNSKSHVDFFKHYGYLIKEQFRTMMPGRVVAVHCMDLPVYKRNGDDIGLSDFSGDIVKAFRKEGFVYHSRHCIWKDPLLAAVRTKAIGLAHKQLVKDSAMCRTGIPDYILAFRKPGINPKPIAQGTGLKEYYGSRSIPHTLDRYLDHPEAKTNKRSHWIWQQYASPVWFDIRQTKVLPHREARDGEDEKHICPLQVDVVERCIALWSAPKDVVFTPFMGVGTEVYVAVRNGRFGLGIELKEKYYRQAVKNVSVALRKRRGTIT